MRKHYLSIILAALGIALAPVAHAGGGYVNVDAKANGKTYLVATWSVGDNPASGHEDSWIAIEAADSINTLVVTAVDATNGAVFNCAIEGYTGHFIKVRRTLQLFREGARLEMVSDSEGFCVSALVTVNPGS